MNYRTARANWTPIDWPSFCRQALNDANKQYRRELLARATAQDLSEMYSALMERRNSNANERTDIEDQLRDIDRERILRTAT